MAVQTQTIPQISIEGFSLDDYVVVGITLRKGLLKPTSLEFDFRRRSIMRNEKDIHFDIASQLLGAKTHLEIKTQRRDVDMNDVSETLAFSGIIFGIQNTRASVGNAAYYHVTAYSPDYLLADNPHCASFADMSLGEIISQSVSDYRGTINVVTAPNLMTRLPYTVQYNETTYQFLSRLAQRFGEFLFFENDKLYFGQTPQGKTITLYPDTDVLGFSYNLNMEHTELRHAQHDYIKYENTIQNGYDNSTDSIHHLTDTVFDHSHSSYRKKTLQDLHSTSQEYSPFPQNQVSATVEGWGQKSRMMTCTIKTNRADICLGDRITIQETADQGSESIVEHEQLMAVGIDYHATIDGHFENTVTAIPSDAPYPPYGQIDLYPVCESQRAIVVDNNDPEFLGRIRVKFLWQELQPGMCETPWLRITQPHGGDDKGFYFIPEIGEEVMVAFENGNGEKPYIVGTLYHGLQHPGTPWQTSSNDIKAIRTRNGHTVEIHDVDQGGYIRIYDYKKENYILTYSTDEKLIKLESTGNIELYADNDIIMHAKHDINITADNDKKIEVGNNRTLNVGRNDNTTIGSDQTLNVGSNREVEIGGNNTVTIQGDKTVDINGSKDERIVNSNYLSAKSHRQDVDNDLVVTATSQQYKSSSFTNIDGGSKIDIKAAITKVN